MEKRIKILEEIVKKLEEGLISLIHELVITKILNLTQSKSCEEEKVMAEAAEHSVEKVENPQDAIASMPQEVE